ncbi:hypothetical protein F4810DRAFT_503309 [Camillea tinctor]|nr:hypothetical protein F4810DRAFT_503309 [Camillea tinctor]
MRWRLKAQVPSISEENNEIYRAHASSDQGSNESDESDEAVTGNLQVVIHGLDRRYPTLKDSGLDRLDDTSIVEFSFDPSTIIGIEASPAGIEHAATELLERLSEYGDELGNYNQTSFIFLACDIGGSVLKQALIIASQTPRYLNVLEQTTALIFFGTPHRPPQKSSWELTLSFLVHNLFQGILGPWLPSTVSLLVAYHSKLAGEFDTIASRFKIINYYQEECNHNSYDVLVEKHSATFDRDGETQIGINQHHGLLSDLYTPEHKRLFISMIERAKATLRNDHKVWLRLLSRYDLHNIMYRTSKPIMRHLCNWILLKSGTYDWIGQSSPVPYDALVTSATLSNGCSSRASNDNQVTQPMVHIIHIQRELHGQSIHILSSLAAAIRDKYTDHSNIFITLNARNRSLPPTPVQLLAALFRQLLTSQPELVLKLKPLFGEAENALHGNAAAWSDDLLWRCLKIVLSSPSRSRVFLIIHEPDDPEQTSTFQKFNYSLRVLLNSAAIGVSWKVIFLRVASLGTRTLESRTISLDDEGFIAAQKDFEAESAAQYWLSHIGINSETSDTTSSYYQNPREDTYQKIRRQYTIDKLATVFDFLPCFKTFYRNRVYGILDYVPISLQSQARFGLTWICGSIRPLTMDELDEILRLGENTTSTRTSPVMTARDFVGFFPGILEIDDNKIFLWRRDLIEPSVVNSRDSSNEIQSDHFMIAQKCLRYLLNQKCFSRVSQPVLQGQVNLESKQSEALLRYAVEYWLAHAKASTNHAALDSGIFAEFLVDPSRVKLWLQLRESYQALHLEACPLISLPSLQILKKELGITTIEGLDLLLLASCTQASQKGDESDWSSIAVAAAQHSNRNILKRLHILGYLDQGETLATIFQTASDEILCQLLYEISGVVWNRIGIRHVFYNAIRRAKPRLAEMVVMSHREDLKFENERQLLLHMAENPLVTWPRSILDTQEAFIENVDQTESSRSRSPLHIAKKMRWLTYGTLQINHPCI